MKIFVLAGGVTLLLLGALYLHEHDRKAMGERNSLESVGEVIADKTFRTKREAYDAFANEKERFYNRSAAMLEKPEEKRTPPVEEEKPVPRPPQPIRRTVEEEQFDEAYREIAQDMDSIYGSTRTVARVESPQPKAEEESEAERRRRAMQRDWSAEQSATKVSSHAPAPAMYRAVIHGTQLVKPGQTALFRTKEAIRYGELVVPANTLLSGFASIAENRLTIKISSVRLGREVFALPLDVYGSDGIIGIPLNYDDVSKIAETQTASTAVQETGAAVSRYGGTVGRIAGSLISGVGNQVRNAKNREIKLIDNQIVIFKIAER